MADLASAIDFCNIGGWFFVASAFFAYYLGMALIVNICSRRVVMGPAARPSDATPTGLSERRQVRRALAPIIRDHADEAYHLASNGKR